MNRREFCQGAVCAAVVASLPGEQWTRSWDADVWKSTHGRIITDEALVEAGFTHDGTDFNIRFTGHISEIRITKGVARYTCRSIA